MTLLGPNRPPLSVSDLSALGAAGRSLDSAADALRDVELRVRTNGVEHHQGVAARLADLRAAASALAAEVAAIRRSPATARPFQARPTDMTVQMGLTAAIDTLTYVTDLGAERIGNLDAGKLHRWLTDTRDQVHAARSMIEVTR